jgi:hypothetical protein
VLTGETRPRQILGCRRTSYGASRMFVGSRKGSVGREGFAGDVFRDHPRQNVLLNAPAAIAQFLISGLIDAIDFILQFQ